MSNAPLKENPLQKGNKGIPFFFGLCILGIYVISICANPAITWPINAIAFLPGNWGALFTLSILGLLLILSLRQERWETLRVTRSTERIILASVSVVFAIAMLYLRPLYPNLEGDGGLSGGPRLRD